MTVKLRTTGWEISGQKLPWVWGQINYWDIERTSWRGVLRAYKYAGHAVLSTAILPRIHQTGPGHYTFGPGHPHLDLQEFLREVQAAGLKLFCWVGPRQLPGCGGAGYPMELWEDESGLARDRQQHLVWSSLGHGQDIYTLPCLIHSRLKDLLTPFAEALAPMLKPFIHPDGPVIGLGFTQAPGWDNALGLYDADYHPETIALYHQFLKKKYGRISLLNKCCYSDFAGFKDVEPPVKWMGTAKTVDQTSMDWMQFREDYFVRAAEMIHALYQPLAFGQIPMVLAALPGSATPNNLAELEKTRCFEYIMPDIPADHWKLTETLKSCAVQTRFTSMFNLHLDQEEGSDHQAYALMQALAAGVRGWDCLNPAGSGPYAGFVINREGKPNRYHHGFWQILHDQLSGEGLLDSQLHADLILLTDPDMERALACYEQAHAALPEGEEKASLAMDATTTGYARLKQDLTAFLHDHHYPMLTANGYLPQNRLSKNQIIVAPSWEGLSENIQQLVNQLVKNGHIVILLGPLPPAGEESQFIPLQELVTAKPKKNTSKKKKTVKTGQAYHLEAMNENKLLRLFQQIGLQRSVTIENKAVELNYHKLKNRLFISVHNPLPQDLGVIVQRPGKFVLKDFWDANKFHGGNNEIQITLAAKSVKFWELIPC